MFAPLPDWFSLSLWFAIPKKKASFPSLHPCLLFLLLSFWVGWGVVVFINLITFFFFLNTHNMKIWIFFPPCPLYYYFLASWSILMCLPSLSSSKWNSISLHCSVHWQSQLPQFPKLSYRAGSPNSITANCVIIPGYWLVTAGLH